MKFELSFFVVVFKQDITNVFKVALPVSKVFVYQLMLFTPRANR